MQRTRNGFLWDFIIRLGGFLGNFKRNRVNIQCNQSGAELVERGFVIVIRGGFAFVIVIVIRGERFFVVIRGERFFVVIRGERFFIVIRGERFFIVIRGERFVIVIRGERFVIVIQRDVVFCESVVIQWIGKLGYGLHDASRMPRANHRMRAQHL